MTDTSVPDNSLYETPTARRAGAREAILCVLLAVVGVIALQLLPENAGARLRDIVDRQHPLTLGAGLAVTIIVVGATVPSQGVPPFIYFAF